MDTASVDRYRAIVQAIINKYAQFKPSHGDIKTEAIIDLERDHYELVHVGWDGPIRTRVPRRPRRA